MFSPNFFHGFFSVEKENKLFIRPNLWKKLCLDQYKVYFLFQLLKLRNIRKINWGKQDWWFNVMNKIHTLKKEMKVKNILELRKNAVPTKKLICPRMLRNILAKISLKYRKYATQLT